MLRIDIEKEIVVSRMDRRFVCPARLGHLGRLLLVLALALGVIGVGATPAHAATRTVCHQITGGPACDHHTIPGAIDVAAPGDTIEIGRGAYVEQPRITKKLTLRGLGADRTTIGNWSRNGSVVTIEGGAEVAISGVTISGGNAAQGGGIFNNGGALTLSDSVVQDNRATGRGGGIFSAGPATITNTTITNNSAASGGGVYGAWGPYTHTITGGTVRDNTATGDGGGAPDYLDAGGGGIFNEGQMEVTRATLSGNRATGANGAGGGAIRNTRKLSVADSTISGNQAPMGGGIYTGAYTADAGGKRVGVEDVSLTLTGGAVKENTADTLGGGLANTGKLTVEGGGISGNRATDGGAGIYSELEATISGATISGNTSKDSYDGTGGGIANRAPGVMTLTGSTVRDNWASSTGGGIDNTGTLTVRTSAIGNNSATFFGEFAGSCTLSCNVPNYGGGIANHGTLVVENSTLSGNQTNGKGTANTSFQGLGGGIYNDGGATVTASTINGGYAGESGGGLYNTNRGAFTLVDSTIQGNEGILNGGGIVNQGTLNARNATIVGNKTRYYDGGGIYGDGRATLANTILATNRGFKDGPNGPTSEMNCTLAVPVDGGGNLSSDATCAFTAASSRNSVDLKLDPNGLKDNGGPTKTIALMSVSPVIDAGVDCQPATDQRGVARPQDGNGDSTAACDSGAFEREDSPNQAPVA